MSKDQGQVGALERATQNRIIDLFRDHLKYSFLGHYEYRKNSNIEWDRLKPFLQNQGYSDKLIEQAQWELDQATALGDGRSLYDANKDVYGLLRYGVKVKEGVGDHKQTVWLIDWKNPEKNDFSIAEEVTVKGRCTRRPDIVLYVNGIAVGVLELKRSTISVAEGILQNQRNQEPDCIRSFFTTLQLVMAGNDTEGLRYGVIGTSGKHYLEWKEDGGTGDYKLDRHLSLLCEKSRLLELLHDFMIYDSGTKKNLPSEPVLRYESRARFHSPPSGRNHLAYARFRKKPDHGMAGQMDT
eukprot:TRINITY_DN4912_c0_g5_i1.p3 TRINITY_DN4912_c0_g5~~TRINITY_DN4912_c0_g5_i1.p3  ORF type:complete len:297 (+),score=-6.56 TRINITY_DN4912_c0_g5_i1:184-1074(+)